MSYTIGDGIVTLALAGGIVGCYYIQHWSRLKRIEIIHQERMAAMDKGIPLPEFPPEPVKERREGDPDQVIPIMGTFFACLSFGTMIMLYYLQPHTRFWLIPLPLAFLGVGLVAFHFLKNESRR